ncbi:hypothetical protein PF008_g6994 [Phytophthora fragariae]|uniref:Uncharacterized protein n=1 Tax=Phytophthora fragariae TaxID=53985 RepID=A0A6G0S4C5_9STRA|nr:hypothetical protein PF008_g6994 [Phytophthora fragariae]
MTLSLSLSLSLSLCATLEGAIRRLDRNGAKIQSPGCISCTYEVYVALSVTHAK